MTERGYPPSLPNSAGGDNVPNRIIKESICTSDSVDMLSWFEEVVFYRLIVNCDDYGRMDARLPILTSRLFPLKSVTEKDIKNALNKLSAVGIVCLYTVNGKPFLQFVTWGDHQNIRNKKSKFPAPEDGCVFKEYDSLMKTSDNNCNQLTSNVPVIQSNPNQSESEYETESECMHEAEQTAAVPPTIPPLISLPLNDKTEFDITQKHIDHWGELYPAVDVMQEIRKMKGWLESNPAKRKTRKGIARFITSWLSKEQDKGGVRNNGAYNGSVQTSTRTGSPQYGNVL